MQSMMKHLLFAALLVLTSQPAEGADEPTKSEKFQVAKFGPEDCISTYPSDKGTCILKTDCPEGSLKAEQNMGLVCADAKGATVRHVFGADSFGHKETFDTLIPCTQCLALDNFDSGRDTEEAVLKDEVDQLKKDFNGLNGRVTALETAKPAEDKAAEAKKPEDEKAFLSAHRHSRSQQHAKEDHRRGRSRQEEDEQEEHEDEEDDNDDDTEQDETEKEEDEDDKLDSDQI